jgi:hypothetical protein
MTAANKGGPLLGPSDWEATKKRWQAFWDRSLYDRPVLRITAPKADGPISSPEGASYIPSWRTDPEKEWTGIGQIISRNCYYWDRTDFFADAFAVLDHKWSVATARLFGCKPVYNDIEAWVEPCITGTEGELSLPALIEDGPGWRWMMDVTREACERSAGRYFTRTDWGNYTGDILAALRGPMLLMEDFAMNRDWLKKAASLVTEALLKIYRSLCGITDAYQQVEGNVNYLGCWSGKTTIALDCDISCMISPEDYAYYFFDDIVTAVESAGNSIYHLDGPNAVKHLDKIMSIKALNAVQWVPGAGHEAIAQWFDLLKHIQKNGRKALLIEISPDEAGQVIRNLSPEGLAVSIRCKDRSQAEKLISLFEKWCA